MCLYICMPFTVVKIWVFFIFLAVFPFGNKLTSFWSDVLICEQGATWWLWTELMKWEHFPCPIALISEIYEIGRDYTIEYYLSANGLISRRLIPAYRSRTDKWRMTDDAWTNKRWTNIGNQAYPWPLKWINSSVEMRILPHFCTHWPRPLYPCDSSQGQG